MHNLSELGDWEKMLKTIVFKQLGDVNGKRILDFGSGLGITASHYALENSVVAVEPDTESVSNAWRDNSYLQLTGSTEQLKQFSDNCFDMVICHNVLEYTDNTETVVKELTRVLKPGGILSLIKHNRPGRVFQMAVLSDDLDKANALLDGQNSTASKYGVIRYYNDFDVLLWSPQLKPVKTLGIRTFWDLQQNQERHHDDLWQQQMIALDMRVSDMDEYKAVAFFHHLIFTK